MGNGFGRFRKKDLQSRLFHRGRERIARGLSKDLEDDIHNE